MPDGFGSDAFQWKNSAWRQASIGLGGSLSNTSDDIVRDIDTTDKLFNANMLEKLEEQVCLYTDHFATSITITNREKIREAACCFWDYAKDKLYGELKSQFSAITSKRSQQLEEELCSRVATLNSIGGTTRSCFAQTVIAKGLSDNQLNLAGLEGELTIQAKQLEMQTWDRALEHKYRAFIEGDNADFQKLSSLWQILRGACRTQNVDDVTDRDISTLKTNFQYNRSAGDIADTTGVYQGDLDNIIAAGGALV